MKRFNRFAAGAAALALVACVEGEGSIPPFSDAGHLAAPEGGLEARPPDTGPAVVAEAGGPRAAGGARLIGQSRNAAPRAARIGGERPLSGPPVSVAVEAATIQDAAAIVLGDALGLPYVVDPTLSGAVSFRTDGPTPPQEILEAFRATLAGQGVSVSRVSGVYRVARGDGRGAGGETTDLIPLRFIAAEELAKALELALPADRVRTVQGPGGEAVLVTGSTEELELARATAAALDVDALSGNSVMLVGLEHAPAEALATELAGVFGGDAAPGLTEGTGTVSAGGLRIVPLDRLGAVLLLARDGATLDRAFAWVRRLDRPRSAEAQRLFVYRVQNRPAASLADSLNALFAGEAAAAEDEAVAAVAPISLRGEPPPRIVVDDERNALVISAVSRQFDTLVDLIRQLDSAPLQVLVETTILEVTLGDALRYGVQYAFSVGNLFDGRRGVVTLTDSDGTIEPNFPGFA
ncbi:MAG: secretin N-terminal domain-containing protein, partial [Pseudomonadota bacterium]